MKRRCFGGKVIEFKQADEDKDIGIVIGYGATWDIDSFDDQFVPGAFKDSIAEYKKDKRNITLRDIHSTTIGVIPIETVKEDDRGLRIEGHINLKTTVGRDAYELVKQGAKTDFSIGYIVRDFAYKDGGRIREITKADIVEVSLADYPVNKKANITQVKAVVDFQDLPLAERDREWDSDAALSRVRRFLDSEDSPSDEYKRAFLWYDAENEDLFSAYKLPIADVIDDTLTAVPRAIFAAAAAINGARGGVNIPDEDIDGVKQHIERYYEKMDLPSPFEEELEMDEEEDMKAILLSGGRLSVKCIERLQLKSPVNELKLQLAQLKELLR